VPSNDSEKCFSQKQNRFKRCHAMLCPICKEDHPALVRHFNMPADYLLLESLEREQPGWQSEQGACTRCIDQAQVECFLQLQEQWRGGGAPGEVDGWQILPTPLRLCANPAYTGKGITICVIDSGFYPHPDLVLPENRILKLVDITKPNRPEGDFLQPNENAWHGTMTAVMCAGNGYLSAGKYGSIAGDAKVVLIKVTDDQGFITGENIARAIEWAVQNKNRYDIRIINLSVSDDEPESYRTNRVSRAVRIAFEAGITVVAAAGNDPEAELKPPASSPHAIAVGGLDDQNTLNPLINALYHSTYGLTPDQIQKPDLIAPAVWLAAPILPLSAQHRKAIALFDLAGTPDPFLKAKLVNLGNLIGFGQNLSENPVGVIRKVIKTEIAREKFINPHYQHADGTSFAAPIVCSVVAQMLEANPALTPAQIREILLSTARPLPGAASVRQGYGVVHPAGAVSEAAGKGAPTAVGLNPLVNYRKQTVEFRYRASGVSEVLATGDFNGWSSRTLSLHENGGGAGHWHGVIPMPPKGTYRYKFLVDKSKWKSDPANPFREPDEFEGFNNQLIIE
jgi:serine protease AprX